jgi:hypothetical protein
MSLLAALAVAAAASAPPAREPESRMRIDEDDHVRIEELRVRGESRRIVVRPKTPGAKAYEIVPASGARDPSKADGRAGGERVWRIFSF